MFETEKSKVNTFFEIGDSKVNTFWNYMVVKLMCFEIGDSKIGCVLKLKEVDFDIRSE